MSCSTLNILHDSGSGHGNNTTTWRNAPADGTSDCLLPPHWLVIVLCILGYILCFFLGAASAAASLYRMVSHKHLRRSHWSTIMLLTISVFVMLVVVPLELTRTTMHFFDAISIAICDLQLFCVVLSQVLAFSTTVAIAIGRVRKIHRPFQPKLQDLPERIAVSLCLIIAIPLAVIFIYLGHVESDTYFTYQYCLMASSKQSPPIFVKMRTILNLLLPVSFFIVLVCLICVYMKGVLYIRKRSCVTTCSLQSSSTSMFTASQSTNIGQTSPQPSTMHNFTTSRSSTFGQHDDGHGAWKNSVFLIPRESLTSSDYRLSTSSSFTTSSNPCSSGSQSTSPHQQFNLTELMPKSSDASGKQFTDSRRDSVQSRSALRKARKTQYSISKALRKASTVSMVSIDTIPEMSISLTEEQPKLLHPLRHTRRSASNMWHSAFTEATLETTMHQSCQFKQKRSKMKKSKSQQSGCSIASSTSSNPQTSFDSTESVMSSHPVMLQKHKRKMSQNSRGSMISNSTISTNVEMQNLELDHCDTESLYTVGQTDNSIEQIDEEPQEHFDKKTDEKKKRRLCSTSSSKLSQGSQLLNMPLSPKQSEDHVSSFDFETCIPPHLTTTEVSCEKNGAKVRAGNTSPALSMDSSINRPPLPPISGTVKNQGTQRDHFALPILQTLENEQLPIQSIIQMWGRYPPSKRHLWRSQSLINFYPNNYPAVYDDFEAASASQPASELQPRPDKTYANCTTQTDDTVCEETSHNIDIVKEQPETEREQQQQPQQPQNPKIRIIRPSLPHQQSQRESQGFDSRRILRNNWCSNDQLESPNSSVHFKASANLSRDSKKYDRTNSLLHRGSVWSEKSISMNRNDNNTLRVLKRSLLLIAVFLFCFLPSSIVHMSASLMDASILVNIYALSRMSECSYFMFVPFLYVYTNASLMKIINRKPERNKRD